MDRPALRHQLDAALESPLALVVAPAGAGKTVLVTQWAQGRPDISVAWFDLSAADRTVGVFARRLCEGIAAVAPGFTPPEPPPIMARARLGAPFLEGLAAGLAGVGEIVLVFDDLDHLAKTAILTDLWRLVDLLPPNAHAVFSSRVDLNLGWNRHRLEHGLVEIRQRELAFDDETTGRVLAAIAGRDLEPATVTAVTALTEGWAAGVQLTALRLRFAADPDRVVDQLTDPDERVMDYLSAEVLDVLRPERRDALMRLALLDEVCVGLGEAVAVLPGGGDEFLARLERDSLFIVRTPGHTGWFRFHRLFRDLLIYRLRATDAAAEEQVLDAAAGWFLASGDTDTAIEYLLRARLWDRAMDLILRRRPDPDEDVGTTRIARWLSLVPVDVRTTRHDAELLLAIADTMSGRVIPAAGALQRLVVARGMTTGRRQIALSYLAAQVQYSPNPETFQELAAEATALLESHPEAELPDLVGLTSRRLLLLVTRVAMGRALLLLGRVDEAREEIGAALARADLAFAPYRVHTLGSLAVAEALSGLLRRASDHAGEALDLAQQIGVHGRPAPADAHLARALVAIQRGEPHEGAAPLMTAIAGAAANNRTQLLWLAHLASRLIAPQQEFANLDSLGTPPPLVRDALAAIALRESRLRGMPSAAPPPASAWSALAFEEIAGLVASGRQVSARERLAELVAAGRQPRPMAEIEVEALTAWLCIAEGRRVQAREHLETALTRAQDERLAQPFLRVGPVLLELIDEVPTGRSEFGRFVAERLRGAAVPRGERLADELTPRELELIGYLPTRYTIADIAERCFLSTNTIKTHLAHIYRKLGVASRDGAIERATELGLFDVRGDRHAG
ncbi:LuxR C-terminal-related transcriptional regulator [Microbacterium sp. NPDC058389]|uniref:LuxR C-terminal-related transcriptional regulator n=1 Tax=Microbacterium sp. NPDC058389 TaxID=3346475 RepID=UPI0036534369